MADRAKLSSDPSDRPDARGSSDRLPILDGWRALSILAVLAGHWLPLNIILPHANEAVASSGMAMFFTLSGFLITRFLAERPEILPFLIRRLLRIVPLAWLATLILFAVNAAQPNSLQLLLANLLFVANLPPARLFEGGGHLWSLGVEMQFYIGVAAMVALGGRRALHLLPLLALIVTALRIATGAHLSITTWFRVDEILAGAIVALVHLGWYGEGAKRIFSRYPFFLAFLVAAVCCYFLETPLAYLRPYAVAALIGATLFRAPTWFSALMTSRPMRYIAEISYAIYVWHGLLGATWLGSGDILEKYLKRPLLLASTVALAHLSTFHFESRFIALAKRLTRKPAPPLPPEGAIGEVTR